mmetsp:Transcript_151328/g.267083  ORF Transcript_151328/g.267083 Transcript_151328/m.267083 type:complete len:222 (-) Transcript_151328:67-732(-)
MFSVPCLVASRLFLSIATECATASTRSAICMKLCCAASFALSTRALSWFLARSTSASRSFFSPFIASDNSCTRWPTDRIFSARPLTWSRSSFHCICASSSRRISIEWIEASQRFAMSGMRPLFTAYRKSPSVMRLTPWSSKRSKLWPLMESSRCNISWSAGTVGIALKLAFTVLPQALITTMSSSKSRPFESTTSTTSMPPLLVANGVMESPSSSNMREEI